MTHDMETSSKPQQGKPLTFSDIAFGFLMAVLILLAIGGLFAKTLWSRVELTNVVIHSHDVIRQLEKLLTDVSNAESAALSYSLAGIGHYVPPYKQSMAAAEDDLKRLRALVSASRERTKRLDAVEQALREKRKVMDVLLALPHEQFTVPHLNAEEALVLEGTRAMTVLQRAVQTLQEEEEQALEARLAALDRSRDLSVALLMAGIVITTLILAWLFWVIQSEASFRLQAQRALRRSHEELEERVRARTAELVSANERLSSLSRQILHVQEEERRSIAQDLHDEIGQSLTALKLNLREIQDGVADHLVAPLVADSLEVARQLLQRVRSLALELRPSLLDELGLHEASKWYVKQFAKRAKLRVTFDSDAAWDRVPEEIEIACFRILQEGLTNIARHAAATAASVTLKREGERLALTIADDGVGFSFAEARSRAVSGTSLGLLGMEERLRLIGGTLTVTSSPGAGTQIQARFPVGQVSGGTIPREGLSIV